MIKVIELYLSIYVVNPIINIVKFFRLRQTDIRFIKRLQDKVNIVPVIAKADTLTPSEVTRLKQQV